MKCPACGNELQEIAAGDVKVDACKGGCGGIWFDQFELQKLDDAQEAAGAALLDIERAAQVAVDPAARRSCPKCDDVVMMRHFFGVKRDVEVDECPGCAGFWLDGGELGAVRAQFDSEDQRNKATDAYLEGIVAPELEKMRAAGLDKLEKARKFAHMFRFICPSYYIPGKQDWGAF